MSLPNLLKGFCLFAFCFVMYPLLANDSIYEQRRLAYIDTALTKVDDDVLCIQAYKNGTVDLTYINNIIQQIPVRSTSDFVIVKLIRTLYFTNGLYDSLILPILDTTPFWLTKADTLRGYWSENHMIMWMSSDWLLHEKYGRAIDAGLDNRLRHYLRLKVKYGFYEFFSSVYAPYTLSGLLNLADFAQDPEIKSLATQAAVRLLRDLLMVTNDKGVMFAVAGRNYYSKYDNPYGQNHNNLIYLLTGMGERPKGPSHSGSFLSTSSLQVDSIVASWRPTLDTLYNIGHTLDSALILHSTQRPVDKVMFQWSSGAYFHPTVAIESANLIIDSMLWRHVDFTPFRAFETFSPTDILAIAEGIPASSMSTVICGQQAAIFKSNSVTLSSLQNFWPGKLGFQQYPAVAAIGTTAVYTGSGTVKQGWDDRKSDNANEHLPYATQKNNVVLLMYWAEENNILLSSKDVALHFRDTDFDEVRNDSLWLFGRQGNGYVAVRRPCLGVIDNVRACQNDVGQTWVIVVGDSAMYGDFDNFEDVVTQAQFTEEWYYDSTAMQMVYYASIEVDTISINNTWRRDSPVSSVIDVASNGGFRLYPNPTSNQVTIELNNQISASASIKVYNMMGQMLYETNAQATQFRIETATWPTGIYMIEMTQNGQRYLQKLVKQ